MQATSWQRLPPVQSERGQMVWLARLPKDLPLSESQMLPWQSYRDVYAFIMIFNARQRRAFF